MRHMCAIVKFCIYVFVIFLETALQNVSMALRGDSNFELKTALPPIGWRIRKHYYLVCILSI